jgi:multiple sugar transport system ATP-binding protein
VSRLWKNVNYSHEKIIDEMAEVVLKKISKTFDKVTTVVKDLSIEIMDKEFIVLVGPSGCGKSTTLRMIAGLEEITSGELFIDDVLVNDLPPKNRDIAMVFQNYALYAHMTLFDNIAFGLKLRHTPKDEIKRRVNEAAERVDMEDYLHRRPKALSGGQRQRVALARAIVRDPKVFLFDEPLSNLDAKLRVQMRLEIARLQRSLGTTTIYVTHDQTEAMTMADRIALLDDGVLQQFDTPMNMYDHPKNKFVAGFIGSPGMNFIGGGIDEQGVFSDDANTVRLNLNDSKSTGLKGQRVIIGIRPEDIHATNRHEKPDLARIGAEVLAIEQMGNESFLHFQVGAYEFVARIKPEASITGRGAHDLFFDTSKLHFFHTETEVALGSS